MLRRRTRSLDSTRVFVSSMSHGPVLHLLPTVPSDVLDIGAGTGRDAAALAGMGHRVVAVEPTVALRDRAALLHPSPRIEWIEDYLPRLARLRRGDRFDVVMLTGVWMHLNLQQRREAMPRLASLLRPGGVLHLRFVMALPRPADAASLRRRRMRRSPWPVSTACTSP
jgi:SAM-dependent methyltransferase